MNRIFINYRKSVRNFFASTSNNTDDIEQASFMILSNLNDAKVSQGKIVKVLIQKCADPSHVLELFESPGIQLQLAKNNEVLKLTIEMENFSKIVQHELIRLAGICHKKSLLIFLVSKEQAEFSIHWKLEEDQNFFTYLPFNEIPEEKDIRLYEFVVNFLANCLKVGHNGIKSNLNKNYNNGQIQPHLLADHRGYNLLLCAAEIGNNDILKILLKMKIPTHYSQNKVNAQMLAWNGRHDDVLMTLLRKNLTFPATIEMNDCSDNLKNFVMTNEELHEAIKSMDKEKITEIIDDNPDNRHFYNIMNVSVSKIALDLKHFDIYELLISRKVYLGYHEGFHDVWSNFKESERQILRDIHLKYLLPSPENHLLMLSINSRVIHDDPDETEQLKTAHRAYKFLDSIPLIQIILMIVAAYKKFKIIFDFSRDSVHMADPTVDSTMRGLFYIDGKIYIAAWQIFSDLTRNEALGLISHELCHFAMNIVYRNMAKPYYKHKKRDKQKFKRILEICKQKCGIEPYIDIVFEDYPLEEQQAELIVRVPHLIALYHDDPERLKKVRCSFVELFNYYEFTVVPEMKKQLPKIEAENQLQKKDEKISKYKNLLRISMIVFPLIIGLIILTGIKFIPPDYKFENLSAKDRETILNYEVTYKNLTLKLYELIKENSSISSSINEKILKNENLEFSEKEFESLDICLDWNCLPEKLGQKFLNSSCLFQNESMIFRNVFASAPEAFKSLTFEQIRKVLDGENLTIGSMTHIYLKFYIERQFIWRDLADKIKASSYENTFESFNDVVERTNRKRLFILSAEAGAGKTATFKQMTKEIKKKYPTKWVSYIDLKKYIEFYNTTKTVQNVSLILQDILELTSKNEFEREVFEELYNSGNVVILWNGFDEISLNHHEFIIDIVRKIFEKSSNIQYICTRPLYALKLESSFRYYSHDFLPFTDKAVVDFFQEYYHSENNTFIKLNDFVNKSMNITRLLKLNTPLMLRMIAEMKDELTLYESQNLYKVYEFFVNQNVNIWLKKHGNNSEMIRGVISPIFTGESFDIIKYYQKLALLEQFPTLKTNLLKIMNTNISLPQEISSIGIVSYTNDTVFRFAHKTFAEFFVAQFFIQNFFQLREDQKFDENILEVFLGIPFFPDICRFITNYLDSTDAQLTFNSDVVRSFKNNSIDFYITLQGNGEFLKMFWKLFKNDQALLLEMLRVTQKETLYTAIFDPIHGPDYIDPAIVRKDAYKFIPAEYQDKFFSGQNQKGRMIYGIFYFKSFNITKTDYRFNFEMTNVTQKYLLEFYKTASSTYDLTVEEHKELLRYLIGNPKLFVRLSSYSFNHYVKLWNYAKDHLSASDLKSIIGDALSGFSNNPNLSRMEKYRTIIKFLLEESKNALNMSRKEMFDLFVRHKLLHKAAVDKYTFNELWKFFKANTDQSQQEEMLTRKDSINKILFADSIGNLYFYPDSSPYSILHYSLFNSITFGGSFSSVSKVYEEHFKDNIEKLQGLITESNQFMINAVLTKSCHEFSIFLMRVFNVKENESETKLFPFLMSRIGDTKLTIFNYYPKKKFNLKDHLEWFLSIMNKTERDCARFLYSMS